MHTHEHARNMACTPPGLHPSFVNCSHTWRTAWRISGTVEGGHPCLRFTPPFDPKQAQRGSYLEPGLANSSPPHPVVPEKWLCHVPFRALHCPRHTQSLSKKMAVAQGSILLQKVRFNVGGWGFYPISPVHSSHHGRWHPIPSPRVHGYHPTYGCAHLSISRLACSVHKQDHDCKTAWSETHHWRHTASSATLCAFSHTQGGIVCDPKSN